MQLHKKSLDMYNIVRFAALFIEVLKNQYYICMK